MSRVRRAEVTHSRTLDDREARDECRALADTGALGLDGATVRLDEVLDDRQTESQPAMDAGGRSIGLPERFEGVWQEVG